MELIDMKLNEYLDVLRSNSPAPGGGSVSALAGAQGVSLLMMVSDLTIGKAKYEEYQETCLRVKEEALPLYEELTAGIDMDTKAYNLVAAAFKMPKDTDEEKEARRRAIAESTLIATEVPLRTMQLGLAGLKLAQDLIGNSNPNAASDLGVAVLNLAGCIKGAWLNVKINLPGIKDEEKAAMYMAEGTEIYDEADSIARSLYEAVEASIE